MTPASQSIDTHAALSSHFAPPSSRVDFWRTAQKDSPLVNRLFHFFTLLLCVGSTIRAAEKQPFVLYAALNENSPVEMADGSKWQMDKGDTFPVVMFKEQQTKVVLQLAGTNFIIPANRVKIIEAKDVTATQLETYRNNVKSYIQNRSEDWKAKAKAKGNESK